MFSQCTLFWIIKLAYHYTNEVHFKSNTLTFLHVLKIACFCIFTLSFIWLYIRGCHQSWDFWCSKQNNQTLCWKKNQTNIQNRTKTISQRWTDGKLAQLILITKLKRKRVLYIYSCISIFPTNNWCKPHFTSILVVMSHMKAIIVLCLLLKCVLTLPMFAWLHACTISWTRKDAYGKCVDITTKVSEVRFSLLSLYFIAVSIAYCIIVSNWVTCIKKCSFIFNKYIICPYLNKLWFNMSLLLFSKYILQTSYENFLLIGWTECSFICWTNQRRWEKNSLMSKFEMEHFQSRIIIG